MVLATDQIRIPTDKELWVDGTNGDNADALRGRIERPFKTIQAAIDAASAGDVVRVRPGTYNELIACKANVGIRGDSWKRCIISRANGSSETIITLAAGVLLQNLQILANPTGGTTTCIKINGTDNLESQLRVIYFDSSGGDVVGVEDASTGTMSAADQLMQDCVVDLASATTSIGYLRSGSGRSNLKGTVFSGVTYPVKVAAGSVIITASKLIGVGAGASIRVESGAMVNVDPATTYVNDMDNQGTVQRDAFNFPRHNYTATTDPSVTDDRTKGFGVGSNWLNTITKTQFTCVVSTASAAIWSFVQTNDAPQASLTPGEHMLGGLLDYGAAGGTTVGDVQYTQVYLTAGTTITKMRCYIDSGSGASRNVRMGLYSQTTPTDKAGLPVTRVAQTNSTATTGSDGLYFTVNLTASYVVPTSGYYWVAHITDNASNLKFSVSPTVYRAGFLPVRHEASTTTVLPATAGTLTNPAGAVVYCAAVE